jgi:hypothetical protein
VALGREQYSGVHSRCLGTSKVNAVYSKMPVNVKVMHSRDANVDVSKRDAKKTFWASGLSKVNPNFGKTRVKSDVMQSRDAKKKLQFGTEETRYEYRVSEKIWVSKGSLLNGLRGFSSRETGMMAVPKKRT